MAKINKKGVFCIDKLHVIIYLKPYFLTISQMLYAEYQTITKNYHPKIILKGILY